MKRLVMLALLSAAIAPRAARADLDVVATVPDLAALAEEVGGSAAEVKALSLPTQDPHFVDAKPSLVLEVNKADLLIAVGLDLEVGWLPTLQTGARNGDIQKGSRGYIECASFVSKLEVPTRRVDRSEGDIHPGGNPHFLFDPDRALDCAEGIARRMMVIDPGNAEIYRKNLESFATRLEAKTAAWKRRLARYEGTPILTYHRSWIYLADWLGFEVVANLEPKPGISPTPRHVVRVIGRARAQGAKLLIQESYYPSKTAEVVADKTGVEVLELSGGTRYQDGQSYLEHIEEVVTRIERALGG